MDATNDSLINFKLGHINIGENIVILEEPITLELSKADHAGYLMVNDDFGILTIGNNFEEMIKDINEQFTVLWGEYMRPDDELSTSGQMLKESLVDRFVMHGIAFSGNEKQQVKGCKPVIVMEEPDDVRYYGVPGGKI